MKFSRGMEVINAETVTMERVNEVSLSTLSDRRELITSNHEGRRLNYNILQSRLDDNAEFWVESVTPEIRHVNRVNWRRVKEGWRRENRPFFSWVLLKDFGMLHRAPAPPFANDIYEGRAEYTASVNLFSKGFYSLWQFTTNGLSGWMRVQRGCLDFYILRCRTASTANLLGANWAEMSAQRLREESIIADDDVIVLKYRVRAPKLVIIPSGSIFLMKVISKSITYQGAVLTAMDVSLFKALYIHTPANRRPSLAWGLSLCTAAGYMLLKILDRVISRNEKLPEWWLGQYQAFVSLGQPSLGERLTTRYKVYEENQRALRGLPSGPVTHGTPRFHFTFGN